MASPDEAQPDLVEVQPHAKVRFAHNSERQFAKLLDFYGVGWEYEPVEFVLERDRRGQPAAAFRPDFYLPAHDLFIEITTLNQKLVTKKNRKVRRLAELYPQVRVKVLYQRDYLSLLVKYGLEAPDQMCAALGPASIPGEEAVPAGRTPAASAATGEVVGTIEMRRLVDPDLHMRDQEAS
ncbi:MAG: hypothetical protein M3R71_04285 [Actinomycetota bacterium]|nr:hypothetical protein [Actinomycetota bacterium]